MVDAFVDPADPKTNKQGPGFHEANLGCKPEVVSPNSRNILGFDTHRGSAQRTGAQARRSAASGDEVMKGKEEMRILKNVDGDEAQEGQAPRLLRDPGQPSAQEKAAHACIHIPFRAWCRECVLGRGRDRQHRRIEDENGDPRVSMDYMFFTEYWVFGTLGEAEASIQENGGLQRHCLTVMVLKDFRYKSIWAYPVEGKGVGAAEWLVTQILEDLDTCGLGG